MTLPAKASFVRMIAREKKNSPLEHQVPSIPFVHFVTLENQNLTFVRTIKVFHRHFSIPIIGS